MPRFTTRKKFGHELGLSACFRQWRARTSHCRFLHGYALAVELEVICEELDARNWCFDYGNFKPIKEFLVKTFDHKLILAEDDPRLEQLRALGDVGVADVLVLPAVGCEQFAKLVFDFAWQYIAAESNMRCKLVSVTVSEHGANSSTYSVPHDLPE